MLKRGKYKTLNGHTAMIYSDTETTVIGNVLNVRFVAYNGEGKPAYPHIPQDLALDLDSRQDIPEWKRLVTRIS